MTAFPVIFHMITIAIFPSCNHKPICDRSIAFATFILIHSMIRLQSIFNTLQSRELEKMTTNWKIPLANQRITLVLFPMPNVCWFTAIYQSRVSGYQLTSTARSFLLSIIKNNTRSDNNFDNLNDGAKKSHRVRSHSQG